MPVYKDRERNTWYVSINYTDSLGQHHKHKKRGFKTRELALDYEAAYRISDKIIKQQITFKQLINDFITYKSTRVKARSLKDFKYLINKQLIPYFGEMVVQKINIPVIEDFQNELLKKNYSNSYTKIIQSMLNRLLNHAVRRMIIDKNPFDYVEFVRHENKKNSNKIRYWTYEEYKAFKRVVNDADDRLFFDMLYHTGMRIGEVQTRKWSDINWINRDIYVHDNWDEKNHLLSEDTKNGKHRHVLLNKVLIKGLKEKYARDKNIDGFNDDCYIFGVYDVIYQQYFTRLKDSYITLYNELHSDKPLNRITLHEFRHSHVSILINSGVKSLTIAERLGHSKEMVERVYGHLFPSERQEILNVIDDLE